MPAKKEAEPETQESESVEPTTGKACFEFKDGSIYVGEWADKGLAFSLSKRPSQILWNLSFSGGNSNSLRLKVRVAELTTE
jgi:hypothetical protein